jgi:hypothetical protein
MTERSAGARPAAERTAPEADPPTDPADPAAPANPAAQTDPAAPAGSAEPAPPAGADEAPAPAGKPVPLLVEQMGGWRGLLDSTLPVVVFVVANTIGGLTVAIWAALASGVVVAALRLARRQSVQQAISGLLGVAFAAYLAHRTGSAKGFFLFGIWASFAYAVLFGASAIVRWPLVGVIWEYVDSSAVEWRRDRRLMRVYTLLTAGWAAVFLARGVVQHYLYDSNHTGWLAAARLAMGYPVTLGVLGITLLAVRRVRRAAPPGGVPSVGELGA